MPQAPPAPDAATTMEELDTPRRARPSPASA